MINLQYSAIQAPLPSFIYEDIREFCIAANRYHFQPRELTGILAKTHGVSQEFILLSAGSNEAILAFLKAFGRRTFLFTPTYKEYGRFQKTQPLTQLRSNVDGVYSIAAQTHQQASLIFLANPNNPFGYTEQDKIVALIENNPQSMVVIDEAYSKFLGESMMQYVLQYKNLAVLRSFSKDYAMAGCRIGYVVARPDVLRAIGHHIQETNVSYLSVGAAMSALRHEKYFDRLVVEIKTRRERLCRVLQSCKINYLESKINVVLLNFGTPDEGRHFYDYMKRQGIILSLGNGNSNIGLDDSYVRITIGTAQQMEVVEKAIAKYRIQ